MSEPPQPPDGPGPDPQPQPDPAAGHPDGPGTPPAYPAPGASYPYGGYPPPQQPVWQPGWGQPPFPVYAVPDLPKATAALVVGIVSVAGAFTCILPILAAPVAWVLGAQARKQIRSAPQQWSGDGRATAGMVLGIIGTVLLVLAVILLVVLVVVAVNDPTAFDENTGV
jgi:hypothetical protein